MFMIKKAQLNKTHVKLSILLLCLGFYNTAHSNTESSIGKIFYAKKSNTALPYQTTKILKTEVVPQQEAVVKHEQQTKLEKPAAQQNLTVVRTKLEQLNHISVQLKQQEQRAEQEKLARYEEQVDLEQSIAEQKLLVAARLEELKQSSAQLKQQEQIAAQQRTAEYEEQVALEQSTAEQKLLVAARLEELKQSSAQLKQQEQIAAQQRTAEYEEQVALEQSTAEQKLLVAARLEELKHSSAQLELSKPNKQNKEAFLSKILNTSYFDESVQSVVTKIIQTKSSWKFKNVSSKNLNDIYLTIISEKKTIMEVMNTISRQVNLNAIVYPKLKLIVFKDID